MGGDGVSATCIAGQQPGCESDGSFQNNDKYCPFRFLGSIPTTWTMSVGPAFLHN